MNSVDLHLYTAWLPLICMIPGLFLLLTGWMAKMEGMKKFSMYLFLLAGLFSLATGMFGGASMEASKSNPAVDMAALHLHAWSAFGAILFMVIMAFFAYRTLRNKEKPDQTSLLMMVLIGILVIAFLAFTIKMAFRIEV